MQSGIPAERVHIIPLGVAPERFRPDVPPQPLRTRKRFKFLFVGRTIARKGFDLLLEAYVRTFTAAEVRAELTRNLQDTHTVQFAPGPDPWQGYFLARPISGRPA